MKLAYVGTTELGENVLRNFVVLDFAMLGQVQADVLVLCRHTERRDSVE
jgi:hypothetical protein